MNAINGRPPFLFTPPVPPPYKIRRALAPPYPSSPLSLTLLSRPRRHRSSSTPSQSTSSSVEPRRSLCSPSASPSQSFCTVPCSSNPPCSSTFIPGHEQEPKVEDNPKILIYFLKHVWNLFMNLVNYRCNIEMM
jgi:hypothetical protein